MGEPKNAHVEKEKNGICGEPGAMKAKSDSRVQGCAGKPLNSRCATISYMEKSEKVVASNRTPKIEKTPFSLNWCKIYDFEPRRVCEDVRGRGRFIAEIDPTWTPDRVPIGRITPLCLFYNPHPLCSLWLQTSPLVIHTQTTASEEKGERNKE